MIATNWFSLAVSISWCIPTDSLLNRWDSPPPPQGATRHVLIVKPFLKWKNLKLVRNGSWIDSIEWFNSALDSFNQKSSTCSILLASILNTYILYEYIYTILYVYASVAWCSWSKSNCGKLLQPPRTAAMSSAQSPGAIPCQREVRRSGELYGRAFQLHTVQTAPFTHSQE